MLNFWCRFHLLSIIKDLFFHLSLIVYKYWYENTLISILLHCVIEKRYHQLLAYNIFNTSLVHSKYLLCSQIAGFNGLSDAFKRLDFRNAVHDVRRFNYICKLLDLLITQKLTMLSGCAQKVLFNMLEEVAYQGKVIFLCY